MGIPAAEVEIMLRLVRNVSYTEDQALEERKKKRRNRLLIAGAIVFWMSLLVVAFTATYNSGARANRARNYQFDSSLGSPENGQLLRTASGVVTYRAELEEYLPATMIVEFQGYTLQGAGHAKSLTEENVGYSLTQVINRVSQESFTNAPDTSNADLAAALRSEDLGSYAKLIKFESLVAKIGGSEVRAKIPVNITGAINLQETINSDVRRRLTIFANQAWRLAQKEATKK